MISTDAVRDRVIQATQVLNRCWRHDFNLLQAATTEISVIFELHQADIGRLPSAAAEVYFAMPLHEQYRDFLQVSDLPEFWKTDDSDLPGLDLPDLDLVWLAYQAEILMFVWNEHAQDIEIDECAGIGRAMAEVDMILLHSELQLGRA